jgi:hypothetical protein
VRGVARRTRGGARNGTVRGGGAWGRRCARSHADRPASAHASCRSHNAQYVLFHAFIARKW